MTKNGGQGCFGWTKTAKGGEREEGTGEGGEREREDGVKKQGTRERVGIELTDERDSFDTLILYCLGQSP